MHVLCLSIGVTTPKRTGAQTSAGLWLCVSCCYCVPQCLPPPLSRLGPCGGRTRLQHKVPIVFPREKEMKLCQCKSMMQIRKDKRDMSSTWGWGKDAIPLRTCHEKVPKSCQRQSETIVLLSRERYEAPAGSSESATMTLGQWPHALCSVPCNWGWEITF